MDAESSDINVLVAAAKRTDLLNHDVDPHSNDVGRYMKRFIIQFHGEMSAPDIIPLDLPFQPMQFAATSDGKFIFLGLERTNQTPVLAAVNGSGELEHYIDAYQDFGTNESIVANAPQQLKSQFKSMQGALLGYTLLAAQFVHYRDSLLLLMPGSKPMVFTIRGGGVEGTALHLPAGLEADSFVPSNDKWIVRATDGTANGKRVLVVVDPTTGDALRIIRSPQVKANAITCVDDGNYYAIQWPVPQKGNEKVFLMKAAE